MPPAEARLEQTDSGLKPATEGWFVVNVGETGWAVHDSFGSGCTFEGHDAQFKQLGINISVVEPGQPLCLYHAENGQEDFLVLGGSCRLIVNGEERPLRAWDFVHSPAGTEHVIVGAGSRPSIVLAVGRRQDTPEDERLRFPASELAARYGASAGEDTTDPEEAYAGFERPQPGRPECWGALPWA